MAQAARKLHMKTTRFELNGKPVTVGVLRKFSDRERIPLLEAPGAVKAANAEYGTNLRLISHKVLNHLLTKTDNWREIREVFPCPAGEGLAYEKAGTKLGNQIVFAEEGEPRVVISTGKYKGEKGIALVVPELTADDIQKDGKDIVIAVPDTRLVVVPEFPSEDEWYMPHEETGIPSGKKVEYSSEARHLWRRGSSYVGLPVRYDFYYYDNRQDVFAGVLPHDVLGVAVEVPAGDAAKIEGPRQLSVSQDGERLIVEGTPEQLEAAPKVLNQLKEQ
ncbi:MAG: hypothetical protein ACLFUZ_00190 [Candidatus Micrarchaeia archaeon]